MEVYRHYQQGFINIDELNNIEVWRDVVGFEGLYMVSNKGRVKSLGNGEGNNSKERLLSLTMDDRGYRVVGLYKNGVKTRCKVHRLVSEAFIPNPEDKPCIDHINTIRDDNRVRNLRWVTYKENMQNEITKKRKEVGCNRGKKFSDETKERMSISSYKRRVYCVELDKTYNSIKGASKELNINQGNINEVCRGRRKTAGGYHWKYTDDK